MLSIGENLGHSPAGDVQTPSLSGLKMVEILDPVESRSDVSDASEESDRLANSVLFVLEALTGRKSSTDSPRSKETRFSATDSEIIAELFVLLLQVYYLLNWFSKSYLISNSFKIY